MLTKKSPGEGGYSKSLVEFRGRPTHSSIKAEVERKWGGTQGRLSDKRILSWVRSGGVKMMEGTGEELRRHIGSTHKSVYPYVTDSDRARPGLSFRG